MKEGNITTELCECLSRLTREEWRAVRGVMDRAYDQSTEQIDELYRQLDELTGALRCSIPSAELSGRIDRLLERRDG